MRDKPGERVHWQGEVPIAPAQAAGLDKTILDCGHLQSGERLTEGTLVVGVLRNLHRRCGRPFDISGEARSIRRLHGDVGWNAEGGWAGKEISEHAQPHNG